MTELMGGRRPRVDRVVDKYFPKDDKTMTGALYTNTHTQYIAPVKDK